jgi:hypothetical protein
MQTHIMLNLKKLKASTALALTLGMSTATIAPLTLAGSASAQTPRIFRNGGTSTDRGGYNYGGQVTIPRGDRLRVKFLDDKREEKEKVLVGTNERLPVTLTIARDLAMYQGRYLIPEGTKIEGEFKPVDGGTQFVAKKLVFKDGTSADLFASSNVVARVETIRRGVNTDSLLKGAAIGSGAAAIISGVTGNKRITLGKVLIGTAAGTLGGLLLGRRNDQVYSVSVRDLDLRLDQALAFNIR